VTKPLVVKTFNDVAGMQEIKEQESCATAKKVCDAEAIFWV